MWIFSKALMQDFENSRCSPEQAGASSAANSSDGKPSAPLSGSRTLPAYWCSDKTTDISSPSPSGMTYRRLTDDLGEDVLTWFLEASLAKTSAQPARAAVYPALAVDYGRKWRELFTRYNHDSHSWKTRRSSFLEGLKSYSPTLPRWGSMLDGALWERVTLVRLTNETASGFSLPTPVKYDSHGTWESNNYHGLGWLAKNAPDDLEKRSGHQGVDLVEEPLNLRRDVAAKTAGKPKRAKLWPTPVKNEDRAAAYTVETSHRHFATGAHQVHLAQAVRDERLFPTPTATQPKMPTETMLRRRTESRHKSLTGVPLVERLQRDTFDAHQRMLPTPMASNGLRTSSQSEHFPGKWQSPGHPEYGELNPDWVEWIMGWPIGWTDNAAELYLANVDVWFDLHQGHGDPQAPWWNEDPSELPADAGKVPKTVAADPAQEVQRVSRIAALGNGQVSAVAAAAFIHLFYLDEPYA